MRKILVFITLMSISPLEAALWSQSKAAAYGQQEQWKKAQEELAPLIVDNPDNAELLYDNGIAAYRLGEFAAAAAYFENVIKTSHVERDLQKQAYFNLGNSNVALKELQTAIKNYEEVLALEPDNKPARHNLEKVKEMLKQQQNQQKNSSDNKDKQKNSKQDKQEQENKESDKDENSSNGNSSEQHNENSQKNKEGAENNALSSSGNQSLKDRPSSRGNQEKDKNADDNKQGNEQRESNNKSADNNDEQQKNQRGDNHASSSRQPHKQQQSSRNASSPSHPIKNGQKEQGMQEGTIDEAHKEGAGAQAPQFASHEKWMARMLAQQEKADTMAQKALIKTNIDKQLAGQDGQNCW